MISGLVIQGIIKEEDLEHTSAYLVEVWFDTAKLVRFFSISVCDAWERASYWPRVWLSFDPNALA